MGSIKNLDSTGIYAYTTLISTLICVPAALIMEGPYLKAAADKAVAAHPQLLHPAGPRRPAVPPLQSGDPPAMPLTCIVAPPPSLCDAADMHMICAPSEFHHTGRDDEQS